VIEQVCVGISDWYHQEGLLDELLEVG
jgi:hypothetical protein